MDIMNTILATFFGAFLGLGSALFVQHFSTSKSRMETIKNVRVLYREEIKDTIETLKSRVDKGKTVDFEILIPSMNSVILSGTLVKLVSDRTIYNSIVKCYSKISHFNRRRFGYNADENKEKAKKLMNILEEDLRRLQDGK